ncbi:hypothetical protein LTR62_000239 [Meristemomyces frigidus]|uniref:Uncharacterized protein n=1 Tax=Meristemomyces frigidus TaxID=1508187 RepID=A0AAN7TR78_9PEZI|nr:hypothetical protein LTR62_000239 [Meristemomyces frigidus]
METIKAAMGFGQKDQQGQEPVSGAKGAGDAMEPYDLGNEENPELGGEAPQHTSDPAQTTSEAATADLQPADEATTTSGKSEAHVPEPAFDSAASPSTATHPAATHSAATTPATTSMPITSETPKESNSDNNTTTAKPSIGSAAWFATAMPVGSRKTEEKAVEQPQSAVGGTEQERVAGQAPTIAGVTPGVGGIAVTGATTGSSRAADDVAKPDTPLPPNHLGNNVPAAPEAVVSSAPAIPTHATCMASEQPPPAPASTSYLESPRPITTDRAPSTVAPTDTTTPTKASESVPTQPQSGALFSNPFGSDTSKDMATPQTNSKQQPAPPPETKETQDLRGSNPKAIPMAGGVPLGAYASEERRKSRDVRRSISVQPEDAPEADEQTMANTAANADGGSPARVAVPAPAEPATPGAPDTAPSSSMVDSPASGSGGKEKKRGLLSKMKEKIKH